MQVGVLAEMLGMQVKYYDVVPKVRMFPSLPCMGFFMPCVIR